MSAQSQEPIKQANFIRSIIEQHLAEGKNSGKVVTRFPPEPNGYLHIGHAKSICLNFGMAKEFNGVCHLRFDDTNPEKEDIEYINAIEEDVKWLGFDWKDKLFHASDYYQKLYEYAVQLIKIGKAYVCHLSPEETRQYRGTLTEKGKDSPYRNRSVEENLQLFDKMKSGACKEGECVLRAKIDMSSGNINLRDPALYRIKYASHPRTGDAWCIYPMYDYAHPISDMVEDITHSLCTLEFQDHRPLYDWVLNELDTPCHPQQIEFARLNLNYTVMSKRKLKELVDENLVSGWDDPRMPTIRGLRRRGYTPASIRNFCERIGISKSDSIIDMSILEDELRNDLNDNAPRALCVLDPIKVTLTNLTPELETELDVAYHQNKPELGRRRMPLTRELLIERDDFMENPPKDYFRLRPGGEVRLRYAYIIKCDDVIKDATGQVIELKCSIDPNTLGKSPEGRKVKGIIHWVSATNHFKTEVRLYDRLFTVENPAGEKERDYRECINPNSLKIIQTACAEKAIKDIQPGSYLQFERLGYFYADHVDSIAGHPKFNRAVTLRDTWK